ncbi:MAG: hypothetical protein WC953_09220 [Pseudomonas sp.]
MYQHITPADLPELLKLQGQTFLSLYMPMARSFPDQEQNRVRYKNLLRELRRQLDGDSDPARLAMLEPFEALLHDDAVWASPRDGLAVIGGDGVFKVFSLYQAVEEQVRVGHQLYIQPLLRVSQSAGAYQVLCVTRDAVRLFQGDQHVLHEVDLHPDVPRNLEQALGDELTGKNQSGNPHGFSRAADRTSGAARHEAGGGGKQEEIDIDRERYFRAIDKAIVEHHGGSGLPLLLAALPRNQAAYRAVSHHPQLLEEGIAHDPGLLDAAALREHAAEIITRRHNAWLDSLLERYGAARGGGLASDDIAEIGEAVVAGRVSVLMVESGRNLPGRVDTQSGAVQLDDATGDGKANGAGPDVLDQLIPHAMQNGAEVVILPPGLLPGESGAAAVFRF